MMAARQVQGARVLILDNDTAYSIALRDNLQLDGHSVDIARWGRQAAAMARSIRPNLMIIGVAVLDFEGQQLLTELRAAHGMVPFLLVGTRPHEARDFPVFRCGFDEYVLRPTTIAEIHSRIEWMLRRAGTGRISLVEPKSEAPLRFGEVEVMVADRTVMRGGAEVELTPKEFELLVALGQRKGRLVSRLELLHEVWAYNADVTSRTVDAHVVHLRRKLEADPRHPRHILTVRKAGYRLVG
jgi:DNA-binding response OmpR family regulator